MITDIIKLLQSHQFNGAGEFTEIAKGKNEYISTWIDFKRKIKRLWLSRKK